jgi:hypothetical protein
VAVRVILSEQSERKDRFPATAVKALDGERSFRRFATQDDHQGRATQDDHQGRATQDDRDFTTKST